MLLDDVEVVEQPVAGRTDVNVVLGGGREPGMRVVEDAAGLVEPLEQTGPPPRRVAREDPLAGRDRAGPVGEVFGAQQLAPDRAGERQLLASVGGALEELQDGVGEQAGDGTNLEWTGGERVRSTMSAANVIRGSRVARLGARP